MMRTGVLPCLLLWWLTTCGMAHAGAPIVVVMRDTDPAHRQAYAAMLTTLQRKAPDLRSVEIDVSELDTTRFTDTRVVISFGAHAARALAQRMPPTKVVHSLLPEGAWEALPEKWRHSGRNTAIVLDQPPGRQLELIRQALPEWNRIALLTGPEIEPALKRIGALARNALFTVSEAVVDSERALYPALRSVLADPAILIVTPDTRIFNSNTVQNVLLTAYRSQSPVLGFSAAYAHAGALLALYSTPGQIGTQTAELAALLAHGSAVPPPRPPRYFEIAVNRNVAHSLGIELDDAEQLTAALTRAEKARP